MGGGASPCQPASNRSATWSIHSTSAMRSGGCRGSTDWDMTRTPWLALETELPYRSNQERTADHDKILYAQHGQPLGPDQGDFPCHGPLTALHGRGDLLDRGAREVQLGVGAEVALQLVETVPAPLVLQNLVLGREVGIEC